MKKSYNFDYLFMAFQAILPCLYKRWRQNYIHFIHSKDVILGILQSI